jgi:hypothetical protein
MIGNFIPSLLFPNPQDPSRGEDEDFNVVGGEIFATFSPWASWLHDGNSLAPSALPMLAAADTGSGSTAIDPGSAVAVTSGGITINLLYDAAALAAPASFRAGIQQAVSILAAAISDKITVNIKIDYSGTGRGASAGPDHGLLLSYSSIRADLVNNATPGDTTFNALTAGSSIQGQSSVAVWNAQLKLWGLIGANDTTTDDGAAFFATDIDPSLLVGVALHEFTHAMGRIPYGTQPDIFDFFRFTSPGTRLFQGGATAPAAYFSLDGGNTKLADYGRTSDASDFLNSGVQGANDPFNEFYNAGTSQQLTAADLKQLDALGFHLTSATPGSVVISDASVAEGNSGTKVETFTVTRSGGTAAFTVNFATANNSATVADHDYAANAGTLNFGAGVNTQTISVTVNGDTKLEANETFVVNLSGATNGATISASRGTGTILDDDGNHVRDFDADGHSDILWQRADGQPAEWLMNGLTNTGGGLIGFNPGASMHEIASGDFNGDGHADILWQGTDGTPAIWLMNGTNILGGGLVGFNPGPNMHAIATGDFNGDGNADILWQGTDGTPAIWLMNGTNIIGGGLIGFNPGPDVHAVATGDFNGDGNADILWQGTDGTPAMWLMNGTNIIGNGLIGSNPGPNMHAVATGDFNADGHSDILWHGDDGTPAIWFMNGLNYAGGGLTGANPGADWHIIA